MKNFLRGPYAGHTVILAVALFLVLTQNFSFAKAVLASMPATLEAPDFLFLGAIAVLVCALMVMVLVPFTLPRMLKPALIVVVLVAAVCGYFMDTFSTVISDSMIANAVETDRREAAELLTAKFFLNMLLRGIVPAYLLWRVQIVPAPLGRALLGRVLLFVAALAVAVGTIGLQYKHFTLWGRAHKDVRMFLNPSYAFYSLSKYLQHDAPHAQARAPDPVGQDAARAPHAGRGLLVVLVVGETARAANFQLDGYARPTNPVLSGMKDVINFTDARSCGTATAESVPCMFSQLGRPHFSKRKAASQETLLDVLKRAGVRVVWRDNNAGCKGVCGRVEYESLMEAKDPALCATGECFDEILTRDLDAVLPSDGAATLLVLHQKGSHGPAYFLRYPEAFRRFTPDCRRDDVQQCPRQDIVNAYDNTLLYTDFVLGRVIDGLRSREDRVDSVFLYMSDHGESLGENGIYLHGLPWSIAPDEQTHIPMVAWFSPGAAQALNLDLSCVRRLGTQPASHDNLFPSMLGLFDVTTTAYRQDLDLFRACRRNTSATAG